MTWETPQPEFDAWNAEFWFTLDVCAKPSTAKCPHFFVWYDGILELVSGAEFPGQVAHFDGLAQRWTGICWCNPPYGREIGKWVKKAHDSAHARDALVVCLVPARTDTKWWHRYIWDGENHRPREGVEVRLLEGRLKFGGAASGAPFPSALVIFKPGCP